MNTKPFGAPFVMLVVALHACLERPAPTPARAGGAPSSLRATANSPDAALLAQVRTWSANTPAMRRFGEVTLTRETGFDTAQVRCVRVTPREAPDPSRAWRIVCVGGDEVLAGEEGLRRYLVMHQFDPRLAVPAARVMLDLRDAMLGFHGRAYTNVTATAESDTLAIDADGVMTAATGTPGRLAHWHVTINTRGETTERQTLL